MADLLSALLPYRLSLVTVLAFCVTAGCYACGHYRLRHTPRSPGPWRSLSFWLGLVLCYGALHTRFDYYAQFLFFIHRTQHLVLHHLGPFLIALSAPWAVLAAGFPGGAAKRGLGRCLRSAPVHLAYRFVQHPLVAPVLFFGVIYLWLIPDIHFAAMLSQPLYLLMNWSMLLEGLLFWWLILDPQGTLGHGKRILVLWAATVPQLILGASIALADRPLYGIYEVCGRPWPLSPSMDQVLGGLLTWIPPAMMALLGMLIVLRRLLKQGENEP